MGVSYTRFETLALLATGACSGELVLTSPGAGPALIAAEREGHVSWVEAVDDASDPFRFRLESADLPVVLTAVLLPSPLDDYGLVEGELEIITDGRCGSSQLPRGRTELRSSLDGSASSWAEAPRSLAVQAVRIQRPCECLDLEAIGTFEPDFGTVPLDVREINGQVAVGVEQGLFFLGTDGSTLAAGGVGLLPPFSLYLDDAEELWFGTTAGRLFKGNEVSGFELAATVPFEDATTEPGGRLVRITGPRGAAPFEIFAVSQDQRLFRFDGTDWVEFRYHLEGYGTGIGGQNFGAVWMAPRKALFAIEDTQESVIVDGPGTTVIKNNREISRLFWVEGLGVVAAGRDGGLDRLDGTVWNSLPITNDNSEIRGVTTAGPNLLFASDELGSDLGPDRQPEIGQLIASTGELCPTFKIPTIRDIFYFDRLGDDFLALGRNAGSTRIQMVLIRGQRP